MWPKGQFIITGVLGPNSNAHGPNEFLHLDFTKKLICSMAYIIAGVAIKKAEKKAEKKDNKDKQYTFKIAMLGGSSVGKTSLVSFYCLGSKKQTYGPTVGGAYFKKEATGKDG